MTGLDVCKACDQRVMDNDQGGVELPDGERWHLRHAPEAVTVWSTIDAGKSGEIAADFARFVDEFGGVRFVVWFVWHAAGYGVSL